MRVKIERIDRSISESLFLLGFVTAQINDLRERGETPTYEQIFQNYREATGSTATHEQLYRRWHHYATEAGLIPSADD